MNKLISTRNLTAVLAFSTILITAFTSSIRAEQTVNEARAVLVPGTGNYSREISTDSATAQQYFDQGLRLAWGFYFPESIASYQEAARLDPDSPMPYWGMAHDRND